jgi:hypothetical protein
MLLKTPMVNTDPKENEIWKMAKGRFDVLPLLQARLGSVDKFTRNYIAFSVARMCMDKPEDVFRRGFINSPEVTSFWLWIIRNEKEKAFRGDMLYRLAYYASPQCLRSHTNEIIEMIKDGHIDFYQETLLANTGSIEARRLLEGDGKTVPVMARQDREIVLAKLGNEECEMKLIREFRDEKSITAKLYLAMQLGYVGSPACMVALAREIRNQTMAPGGSTCPYCVTIVDAMSIIEPGNPLLIYRDINDPAKARAWFVEIEKWLSDKYGITFEGERPAFPQCTFERPKPFDELYELKVRIVSPPKGDKAKVQEPEKAAEPTNGTEGDNPAPESKDSGAGTSTPATLPEKQPTKHSDPQPVVKAPEFPWYAAGLIGLAIGAAATFAITRAKR